jgi:hypothetical protein
MILEVPLSFYQKALLVLLRSYGSPLTSLVCLTTQQHIFKHSSNRERSVSWKSAIFAGKISEIIPPEPGIASLEARYYFPQGPVFFLGSTVPLPPLPG